MVAMSDTVREVTTITVLLREAQEPGGVPDTVRVTQITDRTRARSCDNIATYKTRTEVRVDTVYVEKRDSVVSNTNYTNFTNPAEKKEGFWTKVLRTLKWMVAVMCAGIGMIITIKVCWRKGL